MKRLKKYIAILLIVFLAFPGGVTVRAQVPPAPPAPPEAPSAPPPPPEAPTAPAAPTAPQAPTAPTSPDASAPSIEDQGSDETLEQESDTDDESEQESEVANTSQSSDQPTSSEVSAEGTGGQDSGGNVGDTSIDTGNATASVEGATIANTNASASVGSGGTPGGASIVNSGNGSGSTNTGSVSIGGNDTTNQSNSAIVTSNVDGYANTGKNESSKNVGNTTIETGDANVSGTLITNVNTNIDGLMVSEFNIVDDHVGDYVLDFAANCITGCAPSDVTIKNSGNGADSTNTGTVDLNSSDVTFQTNDAVVENSMILYANSGYNEADKNTGGDSTITTGDANVSANVITLANNNIEGTIIYGVVNIYGDLIGDILFPEEMLGCCGTNLYAANIGNGSDSTNTINYTQSTNNEGFQSNLATIENVLVLDATTGYNDASKNTGGSSSITSGQADVDAQVLNIANTNMNGGNWWLVLVNEAGQWIGRIFGAPEGNSYAGSAGTEFTVNDAGEITVVNSGNGSGSTNTTNVNSQNNNTTVQTNTATVTNTLDLSANTGKNSTSKNTGGNNSIVTGDANIMANIVNFVNNNIIGGGTLFVTVINVFGSWFGDFVGPGITKPKPEVVANNAPNPQSSPIGGSAVQSSGSGGSSSSHNTGTVQASVVTLTASDDEEGEVLLAFSSTTGFGGGSGSLFASSISQNGEAAVPVAGSSTVRINLAWLILLLPFAILPLAIRKIARVPFLPRKIFPAKSSS